MNELILTNFLNRSFEEIEFCIDRRLITYEQLLDKDINIILGIPILSIFECVARSQLSEYESITLASGHKISLANTPNTLKKIVSTTLKAVKLYHSQKWNNLQKNKFKHCIISNLKNNVSMNNYYTQLYSYLYDVSIQITQTTDYKEKFNNVLKLSEDVVKVNSHLLQR